MNFSMSGHVKDVDGGWAWVILFCAFLTRLILGGLIWTMTIFFIIFLEEFGESRSLTSMIGSITMAFHFAASPLCSLVIQKFGARISAITGTILVVINFGANTRANGVLFLIVTHSLCLGLGMCFINNAFMVALMEYFDRHLYFATGLSMAGSGVGIFLFAFFVPLALDEYGWRGASLILSGCSLQMAVCSFLIFSKKKPTRKKINIECRKSPLCETSCPTWLGQFCTSPTFWNLNLSYFFFLSTFTIVTVFYKDFAISRGLQNRFSWALAGYGVGDITGRVLVGLISNRTNVCLESVATQIFTIIVIFSHLLITEVFGLTVCAFLLGCLMGAQVAFYCVLPAAVFGRERYVKVIGYVQTTAGFGAFVGPPIAGYVVDVSKSYGWNMVLAASASAVTAVLLFVVYVLSKRRKTLTTTERKEVEEKEDDTMLGV